MNIQVIGDEIWADGERVGTLDRQHRYADKVIEVLEGEPAEAALADVATLEQENEDLRAQLREAQREVAALERSE